MPDPVPSLSALSDDLSRLAAAVAPSVLRVRAGRDGASGIILRDGLVITAEEALPEEGPFSVEPLDGASMPATLVGRDASTDVALLRVEGLTREPAAMVGDVPPVGALVLALGSGGTVAFGIVSASSGPWQSMRGGAIAARIEVDLALRPEAEGGPLVDMKGRVLGMAVLGPRGRVLAIPTNTLMRVSDALERDGRIPRGYLGLTLQMVRLDGGEGRGLIVTSVDPDGPGARAGFVQGDVVVAWDGAAVPDWRMLRRAFGPGTVGRTLTLALRRDGAVRDVTVLIAARPD